MNFQPADLIFSNPVPILCEIIKSHQEMPYSHVALATGIEDEVIGMEAEGCTRRHLHEDERKDFAVLRYYLYYLSSFDRWSKKDIKTILDWASSKVGVTIYDYPSLIIGIPFNTDVHTTDRWVCSSFIYEAFRQANIHLVQRREPWQVELIHLWISPLLEEVKNGK